MTTPKLRRSFRVSVTTFVVLLLAGTFPGYAQAGMLHVRQRG